MYKQKEIKGLSLQNMEVANEIVAYLKENKVISSNTFTRIFCTTRGLDPQSTPKSNWYNVYLFLLDHELITREYVNGFGIYVATPKCSRTLIQNIYNNTQKVYEKDIDLAIEWQKKNDGLIPILMEARVIGTNFLGLTGKTLEQFIELTGEIQQYHNENNGNPYYSGKLNFERKMSFLFAIRSLGIKKIN